jgi:adenylate cyclase
MGESGQKEPVPGMAEASGDPSGSRRLCCAMFADLVGYSSFMEENEAQTLNAVTGIHRAIVLPCLHRHGGRLVRTMGDGFFAEFTAASSAVACGIEIQRAMAARDTPPPLAFRIGINLGEITEFGNEIYGREINVAARLETLSEPEGLCISAAVHDAVLGKVPARFEDGGVHALRNIARLVHVWRWCPEERSFGLAPMAGGQLAVPSRPSVAVLPFTNMTDDPSQDYFADGLVEEIITALARVRWFFVIARNSSFTYKGRAVDIRQVARELGVRYVLEGSVRKSRDRVRITAQLIVGATGNHIWADTFTGDMEQIFEMQDAIAESVVGAIEPKLRSAEIERAVRKPPSSLDAYDHFLRALPHLAAGAAPDFGAALALLERAIALDPDYAAAHAAMAICRMHRFLTGAVRGSPEFIAETVSLARKGVQLDPADPDVLCAGATVVALMGKDYVAGREWADASTRLNPSSCIGWVRSGFIRCWTSEFATSVEFFRRAMRLSPADPMMYAAQTGLGMAQLFLGEWPVAIEWLRRALSNNRYYAPAYRMLAVALVQNGHLDEAKQVVQQVLAIDPLTTLSRSLSHTGLRDPEPRRLYVESLRLAGLPE